ncbi:hypothetical protein, partial [Clostridium sp.]|uniref:hypothetical protein n=1 Tax=Clostridium sp. TaxID=1506 RepID=UPI0025BF2C6E
FNEFITKEILNLTNDNCVQKIFMYHRYLLCAYTVCHYILNNEDNPYFQEVVEPYKDHLKIAVVFLEERLEDDFASSRKEKRGVKQVFEET